jgi:hypothetical protein
MILHGAVRREHVAQTAREADACGLAWRIYERGHLVPKKLGEPDNGMVELWLGGSPSKVMSFRATHPFRGPVQGMSPLTQRDGDEPYYIYQGSR